MRSLHERRLARDNQALRKRLLRLETVCQDLGDDLEHQKARLEKLGTRLGGAVGGRPRKEAPAAPQQSLSLDEIPKGDKRALRRYFADNPPKEH